MRSVSEQTFHLVMGGVFFVSIAADTLIPQFLSAWSPPDVGFVTFVVGLIWVGRYSAWRSEIDAERRRVLEDRIERLELARTRLENELERRGR